MRYFWLGVFALMIVGCGGSRLRVPYVLERPQSVVAEPVETEEGVSLEVVLPSEEACPGWFEATTSESGVYHGRELTRGPVTLAANERVSFAAHREHFGDEHVSMLTRIPRLAGLTLWHSKVTAEGLKTLPHDNGIEGLVLIGPVCTGECVQTISAWENLRHLYLHELGIDLVDADFKPLKTTRLSSLSVNQCWSLSGSFIRSLPQTIEELAIYQDAHGVNEEELVLMDRGLIHHCAALQKLRMLALYLVQFDGPPKLSSLFGMKALTSFQLSHCTPHPDWAGGAGRAFHSQLRSLLLARAGLTDDTLPAVIGSLQLEWLDISSNKVGPAIGDALSRMKSLAALNLEDTRCDDGTLAQLAPLPNLRTLWLSERISVEAREEFRKSHPEVEFNPAE